MTARVRDRAIAAGLAAAVLAVFGQAALFDFLRLYDDQVYVTDNLHVQAGLTASGVAWAFTTGHGANWHPLTWLSHMLDCQLWGLWAGGHHLTGVLLHAANAALLYLLLARATGSAARSAFVAAVFALHPLRAESVCWVSERKDVLSTLFWVLATMAWLSYQRRPSPRRYLAAALLFALGLMAKPMLVTWPFTLLLLDLWPLGRMRPGRLGTLVREKLPLFALTVASSVITLAAQSAGGAVTRSWPVGTRAANALVATAAYLGQTLWPRGLAVFYPHPVEALPAWKSAAAAALLVVLTVLAVRAARRERAVLVGWLWFLGTLVPVIGLVQVGLQSMADRYTYVPGWGLAVAVAWGLPALAGDRARAALVAAGTAAVLALATAAGLQASHWKDSETLFRHALAVTEGNYIAHHAVANALHTADRYEEAARHYEACIAINERYEKAHYNYGNLLALQGRWEEATRHFRRALELEEGYFDARVGLGRALLQVGDRNGGEEAERLLERAEGERPGSAEAAYWHGVALARLGRHEDATARYRRATELAPPHAEALNNWGNSLALLRRWQDAEDRYRAACAADPRHVDARVNLGKVLVQQGRVGEAVVEFDAALAIDPAHPEALSLRAQFGGPR
ncbi:MAG: tetratricopeptide repeat protein [Planctomycetes bacterium]|nr:tetratricopeptide repeat protein [Planctomycetota bacterium]